ncbi:MAG: hypothetical protein DSM106950_24210 [Stigonema ocellatum SAG 48.90 = DSM 106950]|nr:hypothetical protein [Stigonema ocellatum SAG 48.90 = DSM 106950]
MGSGGRGGRGGRGENGGVSFIHSGWCFFLLGSRRSDFSPLRETKIIFIQEL